MLYYAVLFIVLYHHQNQTMILKAINKQCRMLLLALLMFIADTTYAFVPSRSIAARLPRASLSSEHSPVDAKNNVSDSELFAIDSDIRNIIVQYLCDIEKEFKVKILYACESGSRAWGFPSKNSDYDVRFIYVHPPEYYLSVDFERKPDVIEIPIEGDLDINGWDLRKALQLFRKSNPPLKEWLESPIVYKESSDGTIQKLRDLSKSSYSETSCMYHYYSMTKNNLRGLFASGKVKTNTYTSSSFVCNPLDGAGSWLCSNRISNLDGGCVT